MATRRLTPVLAVLALLLGALLFGRGTAAYGAPDDGGEPCPKGLACVPYGEGTIEVDPALGPVQLLVVETRETTTERLGGETETGRGATAVVLVEEGDGYAVAAETDRLTPAQLAVVEVEDVLVPRMVRDAD